MNQTKRILINGIFAVIAIAIFSLALYLYESNRKHQWLKQVEYMVQDTAHQTADIYQHYLKLQNKTESVNIQLDIVAPMDEVQSRCAGRAAVQMICNQVGVLTATMKNALVRVDAGKLVQEDYNRLFILIDEKRASLEHDISAHSRLHDQILLWMGLLFVAGSVGFGFLGVQAGRVKYAANEVIHQSLIRNFSILDNGVDAIITVDETGLIEAVNHVAESMLSYGSGELAGQNVTILLAESDRDVFLSELSRYMQTGDSAWVGRPKSLQAMNNYGRPVAVDMGISPVLLGDRLLFTMIFRLAAQSAPKPTRQWEAMLNHLPGAVMRLRLKGLRIEYASLSAREIFGYDVRDLINKPLLDLVDNKDKSELQRVVDTVTGGKIACGVKFTLVTAQGIQKQVFMHAKSSPAPAADGKGDVVLAYVSEFALPVAEEPAPPPSGEILVASSGVIRSVDETAQKLLHVTGGDVSGRNIRYLLPTWKQLLQTNAAQKTQATDGRGKIVAVEVRIKAQQADEGWSVRLGALAEKAAIPLAADGYEIRSLIEKAFQQAGREYFITDRDGYFIHANEMFCRQYGYKEHELIGQPVALINAGVHDEAFFKDMWSTLLMGNHYKSNITNQTKNGDQVQQYLQITPLLDANQSIVNFFAELSAVQQTQTGNWMMQTPVWIMRLDTQGLIDRVNPALQQALDYQDGPVQGLGLADVFSGNKANVCREFFQAARKNHYNGWRQVDGALWFMDGFAQDDGSVMLTIWPMPVERISDAFTSEENAAEVIDYGGETFTQVPLDPAGQWQALLQSSAEALPVDGKMCVLSIGLESVEPGGQDDRDRLLEKLVSLKKDAFELCALDGKHYGILIPATTQVREAAKLAQKIVTAFKKPLVSDSLLDGEKLAGEYHAGVGIAVFPDDSDETEKLWELAVAGMRSAQQQASHAFRFADQKLTDELYYQLMIEQKLRLSLVNKELNLVYQPQVYTPGQPAAVEVYLRWENPDLGVLTAGQFIQIARDTGIINDLGQWACETALAQLKSSQKFASRLALNLCAQELDAYEDADSLMLDRGLRHADLSRLELEVLAGDLVAPERIGKLGALLEQGVHVVVDEFDGSKINLRILKSMGVQKVKLAQAITAEPDKQKNHDLIKSIVETAGRLQVQVVAKHVETEQQFQQLKALGVDLVQGYYICKPLTWHQLSKWSQPGHRIPGDEGKAGVVL